ncbi:hypothetical protein pb186bvf_017530 [Paramecium bursaria]
MHKIQSTLKNSLNFHFLKRSKDLRSQLYIHQELYWLYQLRNIAQQ